ncbi:UDP-glucuronosyltransferase 3A1-like [Babylonia areolata]|uniref:UDP-glucuronosyltransferase 3A1-like n=1 Tax=Babylonia areolata TaxID=304850 RepID=UPI003FD4E0D2
MSRLKNVQTVSWFPQNDALGHPNTRLFVSHCGKNSFFEALFHGVPMLCCHFAGSDVLGTAARVAEYGVGLSIDLLTASADSVAAAITTLLTEKAYTRRMKAASKLFHSRPHSPAGRAATAIEHVLRYGGGYLRPRAIEMNYFHA